MEYESFNQLDRANDGQIESYVDELDECYYGQSLPVTESIKTWRFWCLYFVYFTVSGTGILTLTYLCEC